MNWLKYCVIVCLTAICATQEFESDCGLENIASQPLVWGGMRVLSRAFPWHVAIFRNDGPGNDNYKQICGGSLVRSQLVITAAHCFSMNEDNHTVDLSAYRVVGGSLNSSWTTENLEGRQQSEVRAVRLGENYGAHVRHFQDDIAIVHLGTEFIFSPLVRAVCLDLMDRELHNSETSPGRVGKVAGWGLTESGTLATQLNFLQIPVVGKRQCYRQMQLNFKAFITSDKICAGLTNGSAMCPGDSGGGLVFPLQDTITGLQRWYLRAVLSNGPLSDNPMYTLCQTKYLTLYSNIFTHRMWLSRTMEELQPLKTCRVRGSIGQCKKFKNCPTAMEESSRGILPLKCTPSSTKICCVGTCPPLPSPAVSQQKTGSKAKDYCADLPAKLHPCRQNGPSWSREDLCRNDPPLYFPQYRVIPLKKVNGLEIELFGLSNDWRGVTVHLISERWLLTRVSHWDGLVGWPAEDGNPYLEVISIRRTVPHPQYDPANRTHNILLVEMDRPVPFSTIYRPVCLYTAPDYQLPEMTLSLWDDHGARVPVILLSQEKCSREFPPDRTPGGVTDSHLCVTRDTPRALCGSISYLTTSNPDKAGECTQLLVGLVMSARKDGYTCTELFLRLSPYIPWVESVVWP